VSTSVEGKKACRRRDKNNKQKRGGEQRGNRGFEATHQQAPESATLVKFTQRNQRKKNGAELSKKGKRTAQVLYGQKNESLAARLKEAERRLHSSGAWSDAVRGGTTGPGVWRMKWGQEPPWGTKTARFWVSGTIRCSKGRSYGATNDPLTRHKSVRNPRVRLYPETGDTFTTRTNLAKTKHASRQ